MRIVLRHPQLPSMKWKHFNGICEWQQTTLGEGHSGYAGWVEKWPCFAEILSPTPSKTEASHFYIWEMALGNSYQIVAHKSIPHVNIPTGAAIGGLWCYLLSLCFIGSIYTQFLPTITSARPFPLFYLLQVHHKSCLTAQQQHLQGLVLKQVEQGPALTWTPVLQGCSLINYFRLLYTIHIDIWVL